VDRLEGGRTQGFSSRNGYYGIQVKLRGGKSINLNAVQKANLDTWTRRETWADEVADELNALLLTHRADAGLPESIITPSS